jgi:hypothetical protein
MLRKVWTAPIILPASFLLARLFPCFLCAFFVACLLPDERSLTRSLDRIWRVEFAQRLGRI